MKGIQNKKKWQVWLYSPLTLVVLIVLVVFFGRAAIKVVKKSSVTKQDAQIEQARLDEILEKESDLEKRINRLETTEGLEAEIRDRFRVVKDGEELIVIVPEEEGESEDEENQGFFKRLFGRQ